MKSKNSSPATFNIGAANTKVVGDSPPKPWRRRTKLNPSTSFRIDGERSRTIKSQKFNIKRSYEGLQEDIRKLKTPKIEAWENKYRDKNYTICIETQEFSCICPKTGLPDFAKICIEYIPDRYCVELRSFKLYLVSYRNTGIFHEHVINKIFDDFIRTCKPRWAKIIGEFNLRGGIKTTVAREYGKQA